MSQQVTGLAGRQSQWCTVKTALILPRQPLPWFWERRSRISSLGNSPGSLPRPRGEFQGEAFVFAARSPPRPSIMRRARRADPGARGLLRGSCERGAAPRGGLHRASARPWQRQPQLGSHPSIRALYRDLQTYKTCSDSPSCAHHFFTPPRMESEGTSARRAARVRPLCPRAVLV